MIIPAIIILLVILLIANILLYATNSISPPCYDIGDYFSNAKKTSDDHLHGLSSVNVEYKQEKKCDTTDYTSCGSNVEDATGENYDYEKSKKTIESALNDMFPTIQKGIFSDEEPKSVSDFNGSQAALFDTTMEGVLASPMYVNLMRNAKASDMAAHSERDGYH